MEIYLLGIIQDPPNPLFFLQHNTRMFYFLHRRTITFYMHVLSVTKAWKLIKKYTNACARPVSGGNQDILNSEMTAINIPIQKHGW